MESAKAKERDSLAASLLNLEVLLVCPEAAHESHILTDRYRVVPVYQ